MERDSNKHFGLWINYIEYDLYKTGVRMFYELLSVEHLAMYNHT